MSNAAPPSPTDVLREAPTLPGGLTLPYAQAQRQVSLSVLTPVFNERHLVLASLARVLTLESELISRLELIVVDDCSDRRIVNCNVKYLLGLKHPIDNSSNSPIAFL
jgi:Glycosyl transferase family 2